MKLKHRLSSILRLYPGCSDRVGAFVGLSVTLSIWAVLTPPCDAAAAGQQQLPEMQGGFTKSYSAPEGAPPWSYGSIAPFADGSGYALSASGPAGTNQPGPAALAAARLDKNGAVEWAASAVEGGMGITTLLPDSVAPRIYARIDGLAKEDFWTVFGLFDARTGTPVYEYGIPATVDQLPGGGFIPDPVPAVQFLSGGQTAVILDESGLIVRAALLDSAGNWLWQHSFSADAFAIDGRGRHSDLIPHPEQGFWLVVRGSRKISTKPNPPPINSAVSLNIMRLNSTGGVSWAKSLAGLQTSNFLPPLSAAAIGTDGTLLLTLNDLVLNPLTLNPVPSDFHAYLVCLNPDGQMRWARQIRTIAGTGLNAAFSPDRAFLFLGGARLRSTSPLRAEGVVLKLDASTGDLLVQKSIRPSDLPDLGIAAIRDGRLFVHAFASSLTAPATALVGWFDSNLVGAHWKTLAAGPASRSALFEDPVAGGLFFSSFPLNGGQVHGIELDADLELPPAATTCQLLADTSVPLTNPNLVVEQVALNHEFLPLVSADTNIRLVSTNRIRLQPVDLKAGELCGSSPPTAPKLSWELNPERTELNLSFASRAGVAYQLLFSPALGRPFEILERITGDGQVIERSLRPGRTNAFYRLTLPP